ncbi:MAG: helix-turn-helix transcriptional regulator [Clostridia bacterium]|nr:helix-turn-helix transcriptional regulator [Clostridia bacterium]
MKFGDKLKALRIQNHLTQSALADKLGVSLRTLQNYETCKIYPKQTEIYGRIAKLFGVSADYLLGDISAAETLIPPAQAAALQAHELIAHAGSLFSGGNLSEEDMDKVLATINELYWDAKRKNKKD